MNPVKVTRESFDTLRVLDSTLDSSFSWRHVFTLPAYMQIWRESFSPGCTYYLGVIRERGRLIGVAPLLISGSSAAFIGHADVCDYLDFSIIPEKENLFYHALLHDLRERGVNQLDLRCLRPGSTALSILKVVVENRRDVFQQQPDGVSLEMDLPENWDAYLDLLNGKQRHEIRRKMRRLSKFARVKLRVLEKAPPGRKEMDRFFDMFRRSRPDKAVFMDAHMESYFSLLVEALGKEGVLRLYFLELGDAIAAACICFDYGDTVFLYNNSYDPRYKELSPGLLCIVFSIKDSIAIGRKKYDFLKGAEPYKRHLGGRQIHLSRARILMT